MALYEKVPWPEFLHRFRWHQGEHLCAIGPTEEGKTTTLSPLLQRRRFVCVFVTKLHDETFRKHYPKSEWDIVDNIDQLRPDMEKVLLWPRPVYKVRNGKQVKDLVKTAEKQADVFSDAINVLFFQKGWCVVFDEQHYICEFLGLRKLNTMLMHQGRSSGITVVNGTQRPSWVPVVMYSSSTHGLIWKNTEKTDVQRLQGFNGVEPVDMKENLFDLEKHEFIYIAKRKMPVRSKMEV